MSISCHITSAVGQTTPILHNKIKNIKKKKKKYRDVKKFEKPKKKIKKKEGKIDLPTIIIHVHDKDGR